MANGNKNGNGALGKKVTALRPSGVKMRIPQVAKKPPQPKIPYPVTPRS